MKNVELHLKIVLRGEDMQGKRFFIMVLSIVQLVFASDAYAETLEEYLASMDRKPVNFAGKILYGDEKFQFYSQSEHFFGASIDAGREIRERIEEGCRSDTIFVDTSKMCSITGSGSVEIRGSDIFLSIEKVETLEIESP